PTHLETSPTSLHDALPISILHHRLRGNSEGRRAEPGPGGEPQSAPRAAIAGGFAGREERICGEAHGAHGGGMPRAPWASPQIRRSEEHTSELQSRENLVCR